MSIVKTNTISTNNTNNVALDNSLKLKNYTTTQRDALTSVAGDVIYNTTESKMQYYTGTEWINTGSADLIGDLEFLAVLDYSSSSAGSGQNVLNTANGGSMNVGAYDEFLIFMVEGKNTGSYNMNIVHSGRNSDNSSTLGSSIYTMAGYQVRGNSTSISISYNAQGNNYNVLTPYGFRVALYPNSQVNMMYRVKNYSHNGYMPTTNAKAIFHAENNFGYRVTASNFETASESAGFYVGGYTSATWNYKIYIYGVKG